MTTETPEAPPARDPERDYCWCGMPVPQNGLAMCYGPFEDNLRPHAPTAVKPTDEDFGPRRVVEFTMSGEDFRAMLARTLLFAGDGKVGIAAVRVEVTPYWATAVTTDGRSLAVQKMRCEADTDGAFMLSDYDAERMLRLIPKPTKDAQLGIVTVDFVTSGAEGGAPPVNMRYADDVDGRSVSYSCRGLNPAEFPPFAKLLRLDAGASVADPRFIVQPLFMSLIAKAEIAAKDQMPFVVRWHLVSSDFGPRVYATFHVNRNHDEFVAVLMPLVLEWGHDDQLEAVLGRITDTGEPSTRAFAMQVGIGQ